MLHSAQMKNCILHKSKIFRFVLLVPNFPISFVMTIFSFSLPEEAGTCTQEENREIKCRQCFVNYLKNHMQWEKCVKLLFVIFLFFAVKCFLLLVLFHFLCELFKTMFPCTRNQNGFYCLCIIVHIFNRITGSKIRLSLKGG